MSVASKPSKWWEVYEGDEECRFFKALARHPEYKWRTTETIAKLSKLSIKRVQEIVQKYLPTGIVRAHASDADKWQYWERADEKVTVGSVVSENQGKRIKDALGSGNVASTPQPKTP